MGQFGLADYLDCSWLATAHMGAFKDFAKRARANLLAD
jgi:hypothetical protein